MSLPLLAATLTSLTQDEAIVEALAEDLSLEHADPQINDAIGSDEARACSVYACGVATSGG